MNRNSLKFAVAILAGATFIAPAFSQGNEHTVTTDIPLTVGHTDLEAGQYKFTVNGDILTVTHEGKVVAEAEGQWVPAKERIKLDRIVRNADGSVWQICIRNEDSIFVVSGRETPLRSSVR